MPTKYQLSDEQLAALQRTEETVAAIGGAIIRAVKNADQSELSVCAKNRLRSPACNGTIEEMVHILAHLGYELKVEILPIQENK